MRQAIRTAALALALLAGAAQAQDTVRPEVGTPLQAAQTLIKAQKYKDALVKVHDAEVVPNKTAHESYLIERMRIAAASGAGDMAAAAKAYESLAASGKVGAADRLRMVESIAGGYYRAQDYAKAGLPMLPVTHGRRYTQLMIVLYTVALVAVTLLPFAVRMSGYLYLVAALGLGGLFLLYAVQLYRDYSDQLARATFRYSIYYLAALFSALLIDHYWR